MHYAMQYHAMQSNNWIVDLARLTLDCHRFVIVKMHYAMQYHAMQSNSWIVDLARLTFDCHRPVDHGRRRQSQVQPGTAGYSQVQY